ncbi:unnamed protein product [Camellia sinensis]
MPKTVPPNPPPSLPKPPSSLLSSSSSSSSQIGQILGKPYVDITHLYNLDRELGRGQSGITYLCTEKATGLKYACKSILRRQVVSQKKDIEDVRIEIEIQQHLSGQHNIVEFEGAYEARSNLYLVMELCSGGDLSDRITAKGSYSEKEAARIGRQIVNMVHVCHFTGVMHRDLRPENFLLVSRDEDAPLKVTGFGLSVFIEEVEVVSTLRVNPEFSLLFFSNGAQLNLSITRGSCFVDAVVNNSQVIEVIQPPSGLQCSQSVLAPKGLGTALVTVYDIGLSPPLATASVAS